MSGMWSAISPRGRVILLALVVTLLLAPLALDRYFNTYEKQTPDFVARNLIEAVRVVAQQRRPEGFTGRITI
jgi:hypothetical protein